MGFFIVGLHSFNRLVCIMNHLERLLYAVFPLKSIGPEISFFMEHIVGQVLCKIYLEKC